MPLEKKTALPPHGKSENDFKNKVYTLHTLEWGKLTMM